MRWRIWPNLGRDLVLNRLISSIAVPRGLRWRLMRAIGMPVHRATICPGVWIGSRDLAVGVGTFINYHCRFNTQGGITVGSNCDIGMNVSFITSSHEMGGPDRRAGTAVSAPIRIGDGVWIGANAVILPGVTIGNGVFIAAGSLVTGDCEPNTGYRGSPAKAFALV